MLFAYSKISSGSLLSMIHFACSVAQLCPTLCSPMDCSMPGSSSSLNFLGKNTGVGCHFLFQGILLSQGSNPRLCLTSPALGGRFFTTNATWQAQFQHIGYFKRAMQEKNHFTIKQRPQAQGLKS